MGAGVSGRGVRGRRTSMAEINVTPLVDVMLVLLIISMVAAPMLERSINLNLPPAASATEIQEARVIVSVDREAKIRLDRKRVTLDLLSQRMKNLAQANPNETVFLRADRSLPYGEVLIIMDAIRTAGISRVALVTAPLEETG